ncbi:MAG TPA: hypothetical protein VFZ66_13690 [Herpetosiphonaceae bacterium]
MPMHVQERPRVGERRPRVTVAVVATQARRRSLIPRLDAAGIDGHMLLLQGDREDVPPPLGVPVLPPLVGPLLVDTVGLVPGMQVRVLAELATRYAQIPTLLLTQPTDRRLHRLAPSCPAIYGVVSEDLSPAELALWLRHPGAVGRTRSAHVLPAYVGLPAPPPPIVDPHLLALLVALAHAPTIDAAARRYARSERTFYRKLAAVRAVLHLPSRLYRGRAAVVLQTILDALAAPGREGE